MQGLKPRSAAMVEGAGFKKGRAKKGGRGGAAAAAGAEDDDGEGEGGEDAAAPDADGGVALAEGDGSGRKRERVSVAHAPLQLGDVTSSNSSATRIFCVRLLVPSQPHVLRCAARGGCAADWLCCLVLVCSLLSSRKRRRRKTRMRWRPGWLGRALPCSGLRLRVGRALAAAGAAVAGAVARRAAEAEGGVEVVAEAVVAAGAGGEGGRWWSSMKGPVQLLHVLLHPCHRA